ncbi:MAG TPA: asparagine synthase (glutamine-hydrolyzing) [Solirubrobacteraceae bacterium]|nr:asparagine synthase (glutamine-hydrolyzing) [Solirubrobacteraceae bacterium]
MCGIVGQARTDREVERALLAAMCETIVHRGPDATGIEVDGGTGLAVQRLAVIDLVSGDQPVANEDGSVVVVLNGEIYNYVELRRRLEAAGHRLSTRGDTEVIAHLYEEMGDRCVEELRGMFAFALWDKRRRRLLLARDRIGKKPLFYHHRDGCLTFASETKALLADRSIPRVVDEQSIDQYLHFQHVGAPWSAFRGVHKLPPAHVLSWQAGQIDVRRYWKLSFQAAAPISEEDAAERLRDELLDATRIRLRSDVPLGAYLSGGIDSSAVVAAMARTSSTVKTFAIGFDVAAYDETSHAQSVADLFGTDHRVLHMTPDALELLPQLAWSFGEPFADQSAIPSFYLARMTREHVTVALNGDGGDEAFAGYPRYLANVVTTRMADLPGPLVRTIGAAANRFDRGVHPASTKHRIIRLGQTLSASPPARYATWLAYLNEVDRERLYTSEYLAHLRAIEPRRPYLERAWTDSDAGSLVNRLLDVDIQSYLPGDLLVKADISSMAHSLELRSPFLDHRFMEFAAALPGRFKLRGGVTKHILRRALKPWLPEAILQRPKMGFEVPLAEWFRGELSDLPGTILLDETARSRGMFRPDEVQRLISEHAARSANHASKLWALLQLELWLRTYVDRVPQGPVSL